MRTKRNKLRSGIWNVHGDSTYHYKVKNLLYVKGLTFMKSTTSVRSYSILCTPDSQFLPTNLPVPDTVYWRILTIYFHPLLCFSLCGKACKAKNSIYQTPLLTGFRVGSSSKTHLCKIWKTEGRELFLYTRGRIPHSTTQHELHRYRKLEAQQWFPQVSWDSNYRVLTLRINVWCVNWKPTYDMQTSAPSAFPVILQASNLLF